MERTSGEHRHVLITGGSGFIGSHFSRKFDELGIPYTILDLYDHDLSQNPKSFVRGDVRDEAAVRRALNGCTDVLHLAAAHHDSGIDRETYFSVNESATGLLYQLAMEHQVERFCFFSSAAVYGAAETVRSEACEPQPTSPYGESKLAGELTIRAKSATGAVPVLIVRPSVTFGPGNFANMFSLIRQIDSGQFVQVGRGTNIKSLSYVENLVDFTLWVWPRVEKGVETYNWVEYPDWSSRQIVTQLASLLGRRLSPLSIPVGVATMLARGVEAACAMIGRTTAISPMRVRKLAVEQTFFTAQLARSIGFSPSVSLEDGLSRTVKWYQDSGKHQPIVRRLPPHATSI